MLAAFQYHLVMLLRQMIEPLKMINKTDHSIISWSVSAITGTICDSVSKPPLMFQVTAMPQNMDNNGEYDVKYTGVSANQSCC